MAETNLYQDIAARTGGDIYIGVVGPVRSGKSTFIKKFMETLVVPNIESEFQRGRTIDEIPQSAAGKTIMTTEPKFIPEEGVKVALSGSAEINVRMIDCVGYIVPSAIGYIEDGAPRMVMTPWFEEAVPFNMAAELGTRKVITEDVYKRQVQRKSAQKKMDPDRCCRLLASLGGWRAVAGRYRKAGNRCGNPDFVLPFGRTISFFRMVKRRNPFSNGRGYHPFLGILLCLCAAVCSAGLFPMLIPGGLL